MTDTYPETSWSLLGNACGEGEAARAARDRFVRLYHRPVRAYLRAGLRCSDQDAEEHAQQFFVSKVFDGKVLGSAEGDGLVEVAMAGLG